MGLHRPPWEHRLTSAVAVGWCLVVLVTAGCGAVADARASRVSTPTAPVVSTSVVASDRDSADSASVVSVGPVARTGERVGGWERVLDRLDRLRSRAFERQRPALLRRVYVSGSTVLRHERAVLDGYRDRGIRLLGVRLHLEKLRVVSADRNEVRLRVVERLGPTTAVVQARRVRLPVDAPTSRVLHLVRDQAGWRIAAAHRVAG